MDCPYCRQFHRQVAELNGYGVEVRYLAYPRAGPHSDTGGKMASAWCAQDRRAALAMLKNGERIEPTTCEEPVAEHLSLGEKLHVEGTPTVITEMGERIPGYLPAAELAERLGLGSR